MKKLLYFTILYCICSMIFAFRLKTDSNRNASATKRYQTLRKQYSVSCRTGWSPDMADTEIGALKGWGDYRWKITTASDSVQFYFDQGINMYYAYHIVESIASFRKAIRLDSTCAMAWYGKALAVGYSIDLAENGPVPAEAIEAAKKSMQYAGVCTPLEKSLIAAQAVRFTGDSTGGIVGMMQRYEHAMSVVAKDNAGNADALTLYADALTRKYLNLLYEKDLTPKPWTNDIMKNLMAAIAIAPRHPGAHHMLVHTLQGSSHPQDAMHSAEILPSLMPGMAHMVHMPSHIYLRTGFYQKGITINDEAIAAFGNTAKEFSPVAGSSLFYSSHPTHVKAACAIMSGDYSVADAAAVVLRKELTPELLVIPGPFGTYMQYGYQTKVLSDVRFGKWEELLKEETVDTLAYAAVLSHFGKGIANARLHKLNDADSELRALEVCIHAPELKEATNEIDAFYEPATIARDILKGVIATERKQYKQAIAAFERASITDDSLSYGEPRYWLLPARHYLGDVYLQMKNYKKAIEVFNQDLELNPGNIWAFNGLLAAYTATSNTKDITTTKEKMKKADLHAAIGKPVY
ncbi:tetratricopeptide repeat protein [Chitinophaga sp. S165]|uniref:tetratricopeptide repeat protein n=1 Tax=Chitinophaga sp. S165 TaxID=2135462 RepID=UPI000D70E3B4|nr:tetratricopeptide repeat protein [Chitinophaga sp. S165]PWV48939.1 tetratricopeptide repeat protein [Chitinophaga sp. S165]